MTGFRRLVSVPSVIGHAVGDSSTNVEIDVRAVTSPTAIVIEKHHYAPHEITFEDPSPCDVAPYRWIIRSENPQVLSGRVKFMAKGLRFVNVADGWQLRWRPREGSGRFSVIDGANFDVGDSSWSVPTLVNGEYALVSASCIMPSPLAPANNAVVTSKRPNLVFSRAAGASAYEVQVAESVDFSEILYSTTLVDTQLTVVTELRAGVPMFWRVRRLRSGRPGMWSSAASFSILPTSPVLIFPRSVRDTVGVARDTTLCWAPFDRANSYRVVVSDLVAGGVLADTVVEDTVLPLPPTMAPSRAYTWFVRANTDTGTTATSSSFFGTLPDRPWIMQPEPSVYLDGSKPVVVQHRRVPNTDSAEAIVGLVRAGTVGIWPVFGQRVALAGLPTDQDLLISVRVRGRYGWSESALRRVRVVRPASLTKPVGIQPLDGDFVLVGANATFEWEPVDGATSYHLQATGWVGFDRLTVDTVVSTNVVMKRLDPAAPFLQWRVQPRSEMGLGPWSDTAYINLKGSSTLPLVPITPKFGARAVPTSGVMAVSNRSEYPRLDVEVGTDPYLDYGVRVFGCIDSLAAYSTLRQGARHYWRPVAFLSDSSKLYGPTSLFTTDGVSGIPDPGQSLDHGVWYDRNLHSLVLGSFWRPSARLACYTYDGRLLLSTSIQADQPFVELPPEVVFPAIVFIRICDSNVEICRFLTLTVR